MQQLHGFDVQNSEPAFCLRTLIEKHRNLVYGLRPFREIEANVRRAIELLTTDPHRTYTDFEPLGDGAQAEVFKVRRRSDGREFAIKKAHGRTAANRQKIVNEASLVKMLGNDEVVTCYELYEHGRDIWIVLEYMNNGAMTDIILDDQFRYSEEFCKYTLYKAAKGLASMHRRQVLHRDIKSDNILCNMEGAVKIADLGLSKFLTQEEI